MASTGNVLRIDLTLHENELEEGALKLLEKVKPVWNKKDIKFKVKLWAVCVFIQLVIVVWLVYLLSDQVIKIGLNFLSCFSQLIFPKRNISFDFVE